MSFYAHTVVDKDGNPLPEDSGKWQPPFVHLHKVTNLINKFSAPLGVAILDL